MKWKGRRQSKNVETRKPDQSVIIDPYEVTGDVLKNKNISRMNQAYIGRNSTHLTDKKPLANQPVDDNTKLRNTLTSTQFEGDPADKLSRFTDTAKPQASFAKTKKSSKDYKFFNPKETK